MLTVLRYNPSAPILSQCYFATGRSCITHLIRKYQPGGAYLPEMYPEGLIAPFTAEGIQVHTYRLRADLEPDLDDLDSCLEIHKHDRPLVALVHYFGYWMPSYGPAALAHQRGGILFEDCAHCLPVKESRGACGDVQLFSLNKFFPVADGALMLSCSPHVDLSFNEKDVPKFQTEAVDAYRDHLAENRLLAAMPIPETEMQQRLKKETLARSRSAYDAYYAIISKDMEPRRPTLETMVRDVDGERERRIENAKFIIDRLSANRLYRSGTPVFALPVQIWEADDLAERFEAAGVIPSWLHDKWTVPEGRFRKTHMLIPLNQKIEAFK